MKAISTSAKVVALAPCVVKVGMKISLVFY